MARSVIWFRRDLRLQDHPAFVAAANAGEVVPLFVIDPIFTAHAGAPRQAFLAARLRALDDELGGTLVVRHGDPTTVVPQFADEADADAVFVTKDFGPYGRRRDTEVAERLRTDDRRLAGVGTNYAVEPGKVVKGDGSPYAVFTPFSKAWMAHGWTAPVDAPRATRASMQSDAALERPTTDLELPSATTDAWHGRWERFVDDGLHHYDDRRNLPGVAGTSHMSIALRWGIVHPRQLLEDLGTERAHEVFRKELAWRDFYADVLFHRPETAWEDLQPRMEKMPVDTGAQAKRRFAAWQAGATGYPIVDAGMRQLLATGWMHNRVRMIVASFLVKDIHLPWQWGAKHFMQHLLDGDIASNNHGWQWTAGTGTDAAPYFRVFNPTAQSQRYDPDGAYLRQWIPEIADLSDREIHQPGSSRPDDYPDEIIDHAAERAEALRRYKSVAGATR